jgi:hypothetical protein
LSVEADQVRVTELAVTSPARRPVGVLGTLISNPAARVVSPKRLETCWSDAADATPGAARRTDPRAVVINLSETDRSPAFKSFFCMVLAPSRNARVP